MIYTVDQSKGHFSPIFHRCKYTDVSVNLLSGFDLLINICFALKSSLLVLTLFGAFMVHCTARNIGSEYDSLMEVMEVAFTKSM